MDNNNNYQPYGQNTNINGSNYQQYGQNQTSYAGGYQQPNNFQNSPVNYTEGYQQIKKKTPIGMYIILIAVIILFAVIIISMSAVMRSMMDSNNEKGGDKKDNDNMLIADVEDDTDDETDSENEDDETEEDIRELSVPDVSKFQESPDKQENGVMVYVTWNAVENADGYEIENTETENNTDAEPYKRTIFTPDTYFETGASVPINIQVRVRAYKNKDDGKIYSGWSEISECNLSEFMKNKNTKVSSTPVYYVKINNYHLPIYKNASYENPAHDYINDRGTYTITERSGHWGKLKSGAGWINLDDADNFGSTYGREKAYISTEKDPLTIRYAPLTDSKAQGYIPRGETVYVYYIDVDGWYYVRYKDTDGFIDKRYVTLGKAPAKFESYKLEVNNYNLPVYKDSKYSSKINTHIRDREVYTIVETNDSGKWGKLLSGDGWINLSDARKFGKTGTPEKAYVTTNKDPLSLRQGPDMSADILTEIPKGEIIDVCEVYMDDNNPNKASKEWYYVRYRNKEGFVSAKYVTLGEPATTETTTEKTETETTTERTEPPVTEPPETEPIYTEPPVTEPPITEPPIIDTPIDTPVINDESLI
ncbi:MAG: SH3 domain-containing protein [Ruminococcus sp.]|nr:SH3 domain-containing protein [Ruminococcus sp.]